jgi:hypothetical protein
MMRIIKWLIIPALLITSLLAFADDNIQPPTLYQVDVIVFSHLNADALASEQWQPITEAPNIDQASEPDQLPFQQSQLQQTLKALNNNQNYTVLANYTWQQPIPVSNKAVPIHIYGGKSFGNIYELDGTITINRDRYFNLATNLVLTEPSELLGNIGQADYGTTLDQNSLVSFQLKEQRRLKSKELNYIDHPLFGMLIEINKVKDNS